MLLLMDAHSGFPVHYNNSDLKKKYKVDKPFTRVQCEYHMLEYEHLFRHHPGADSARTQVRPEQHTLISVFKLNSCKLCQFKHLRARGRELTRAVRRFVCVLIRSAQTRASELTQILSSIWSIVFEWTNSHKNYAKMPVLVSILADIAGWTYSISALDQCILLKWQHFLNINQTATTKKSLTALDWIAFVTLIKINL